MNLSFVNKEDRLSMMAKIHFYDYKASPTLYSQGIEAQDLS